MFIGRKSELEELNSLLEINIAHLIVIKGRRRIGKSRLIAEFAKSFTTYSFTALPPTEETTVYDQRAEFIRLLCEQFGYPKLADDDWGNLFTILAKECTQGRVVIIFDEISWMAHGDPNFLGKLKVCWDLYFSKNEQLILILCGSVSSWIEKNILSSTGFLGRPSLHLTLDELPLDDCNEFWGVVRNNISAFEKLKILSITGGVPRYLELINPKLSAEDNIKKLCFNPNSPLFDEFKYIFSDIYGKRSEKYQSIVIRLSKSVATREQLITELDLLDNGDTSDYLEELHVGGFLNRDYTWNIKDKKTSNLCHYRLKDNYTRFYLKYILPNKTNIMNKHFAAISVNDLPGWNSILALQFENLVLNNHKKILELLKINPADVIVANPYFQRATLRNQGCQIDYMIQTKHDIVYVCEIKFTRAIITFDIIATMQEKITCITLPKYMSRRAVLIHVNGVSDEVYDANYFSNIIDFGEFLKKL